MTLKLASANILKDYRQARKRKEENLKRRKHSRSVPECPESMDKKEETLKKCTRMSGKHGQKRGNTQEVYQDVRKAWTKKRKKAAAWNQKQGE